MLGASGDKYTLRFHHKLTWALWFVVTIIVIQRNKLVNRIFKNKAYLGPKQHRTCGFRFTFQGNGGVGAKREYILFGYDGLDQIAKLVVSNSERINYY